MAPSETSATFETFQVELTRLVARFDSQHPTYTAPDYNEQTLRADFLDQFFTALGWDVGNHKGLIHTEREVDIEVRTHMSGRQTRADYVFRLARVERFTCEAKKPAEVLHNRHIFQAKRDAYARGVPLALLSDFEETKIYIVGARPHLDDPHTGEFKVLHFRQYNDAARELWDLLAYENVRAGSIDKLIESLPKRPLRLKGRQGYLIKPDRTRALDADFLNFLDDVRQQLGSDLLKHNDRADLLEGHRLNEAAQRIIDRLVFLRICEDRGIDTGTLLQTLFDSWYRQQTHPPKLRKPGKQSHLRFGGAHEAETPETTEGFSTKGRNEGTLYRELTEHIRSLDQRPPSYKPFFNGQLFKPHFSEELIVGDEWLSNFLLDLVDDDTGYNFADIKVEILGDAYERFLGKILRPQGRGATIEEKPEVRKAGGVYYTPRYITDYIVEQTVGRLLENKSPKQAEKLKIVDPACGSGSFLLRAYERVMEHYLRWFTANPEKRRKEDCYVDDAKNVRLTTTLKRRILENNIHGVDIDAQAVEVTQLSLYLKMLEGENRETLRQQTELFRGEPLLPPLDKNIKCFNSLIASDFSLDPAELVRVNAGDWDVQFPEIMKAGRFDALVGNPPWGASLDPIALKYLSSTYARVVQRMIDTYIYFCDQALRITKDKAFVGVVIPSTVLNQVDTAPVRKLLLSSGLRCVVNLGKDVFTKKVLNTTTLIVTSGGTQPEKMIVGDLSHLPVVQRGEALIKLGYTDSSDWLANVSADSAATFFTNSDAKTALFLRLRKMFGQLADATEAGIARGVSPDIAEAHVIRDNTLRLGNIEKDILRRSISGPKIKRYGLADADQWIIYTTRDNNPRKIPHTIHHLEQYRSQNTCSEVRDGKHPWWALHRARNPEIFKSPKIIGLTTTKTIELILDDKKNLFVTDAMYVFRPKPGVSAKALMGVLQSKLFLFLYRVSNQGESRVIPQIKAAKLEPLPIPDLSEVKALQLVALVDKMLALTPALRAAKSDAMKTTLQNALTKTDRKIDQFVYQLYGLTPEEIALVEKVENPGEP